MAKVHIRSAIPRTSSAACSARQNTSTCSHSPHRHLPRVIPSPLNPLDQAVPLLVPMGPISRIRTGLPISNKPSPILRTGPPLLLFVAEMHLFGSVLSLSMTIVGILRGITAFSLMCNTFLVLRLSSSLTSTLSVPLFTGMSTNSISVRRSPFISSSNNFLLSPASVICCLNSEHRLQLSKKLSQFLLRTITKRMPGFPSPSSTRLVVPCGPANHRKLSREMALDIPASCLHCMLVSLLCSGS